MKFRYKVIKTYGVASDRMYLVTIQEYHGNACLRKWRVVERKIDLRRILHRLNLDAFTAVKYLWQVHEKALYEELQKYNSMEEIIMKYICQYVLQKRTQIENMCHAGDLIDQFVLKDGWNTIEVKEYQE